MVLLSTIASATGGNTGKALIESVIKLIFFLVLWFVVGMYLLPMIFKKIKKFLSNEILLIISIGLCFLMVTLADLVGFSSALGAFVMGSLLAETVEGENIERLVGGIKDLFGAIFFVSVGMMVDPAIIAQYWFTIVLLIIVAILGRLIFSTAGALLSGQGISNAVHASFSLSQLGEFAFIIASLGCSLGVMRDFFYPAVVAASAITTFTTPFMIKAADPVTNWLYKVLPTKVISRLDTAADKEPSSSKASSSVWKKVLKSYFTRVLVYYVILLAIYLTSVSYMPALVNTFLPDFSETVRNIVSVVVTLAVMTPFIFGLVKNSKTIKEGTQHLLEVKRSNRWPILALLLFRMTLAVGVIVGTIMTHFELSHFDIILVAIALVSIIMQTRNSVHKFSRLEDTFEANLNDKELAERRKNPVSSSVKEKMAGYDVHIEAVTLPQESRFAGAKLRDMPFRKDHSINIIKIQRGRKTILIPNGDEPVFPCDVLLAVGTTEQIEKFREKMDEVALRIEAEAGGKDVHEDFIVDSYTLTDESFLVGKTLRQSDMRHSGCMMISVMRDGKFTANPDADTPFKAGDTVWIAGEKEACKWFV